MSKASDSISQRVVLLVLSSRYVAELETRAFVPPDERNRAASFLQRGDQSKTGLSLSALLLRIGGKLSTAVSRSCWLTLAGDSGSTLAVKTEAAVGVSGAPGFSPHQQSAAVCFFTR